MMLLIMIFYHYKDDWNDDINDDADDEFVHLGGCFEAQHHLSETHLHLQPSD